MKKIFVYLSMLLSMMFALSGCDAEAVVTDQAEVIVQQLEEQADEIVDILEEELPEDLDDSETVGAEDADPEQEVEEPVVDEEPVVEEEPEEQDDSEEAAIDEDGSYTSRDEVALYIHTYGKLPKNFITKQEAEDLGWDSREGNLDEVAPGMSIGGNKFGNYEQLLPDGKYKECDINYSGGYRGDERIVYSEDGNIYYTDDHYATFTQLYSSEE